MAATDRAQITEITRRVARRTVEIGYPDWDWGEGVAWHGVAEAGARLPDPDLLAAARRWVSSHAGVQPTLLRHVMPALAALSVARSTDDPLGIELARRVRAMLDRHPRNEHGVYAESDEIPVWVDYWYEIAPVLTALAAATGEASARALAAEQSLAFVLSCWDSESSLFHHVYYDRIHRNSQWFWARADAWAALAAVEMLTDLADVAGVVPVLGNVLRRQAARLADLQDASGLWHTVLDQPSTYLEASASVMIGLAFKRGVRRGYLEGRFEKPADRAFSACLELVDPSGNLLQTSGETYPGDLAHYSRIPIGHYPWGQGFMVLAGLEWLA